MLLAHRNGSPYRNPREDAAAWFLSLHLSLWWVMGFVFLLFVFAQVVVGGPSKSLGVGLTPWR